MDNAIINLSKYRLDKANEELIIAKTLLTNNFYAKSLNSSYYAMFHATRALLSFDLVDSKKHSGIINFFNNLYIKTNKIPEVFFTHLSTAFNIRLQSDYKDFFIATKEDAVKQVNNALSFIEMITSYLSKDMGIK